MQSARFNNLFVTLIQEAASSIWTNEPLRTKGQITSSNWTTICIVLMSIVTLFSLQNCLKRRFDEHATFVELSKFWHAESLIFWFRACSPIFSFLCAARFDKSCLIAWALDVVFLFDDQGGGETSLSFLSVLYVYFAFLGSISRNRVFGTLQ